MQAVVCSLMCCMAHGEQERVPCSCWPGSFCIISSRMTSYTLTAHDTQSGMHRPSLTPMHRAQLRGVGIILQDKPDGDTILSTRFPALYEATAAIDPLMVKLLLPV